MVAEAVAPKTCNLHLTVNENPHSMRYLLSCGSANRTSDMRCDAICDPMWFFFFLWDSTPFVSMRFDFFLYVLLNWAIHFSSCHFQNNTQTNQEILYQIFSLFLLVNWAGILAYEVLVNLRLTFCKFEMYFPTFLFFFFLVVLLFLFVFLLFRVKYQCDLCAFFSVYLFII